MTKDLPISPQTLAGMEFFRELPAVVLEAVAASARVRVRPKETRIFSQGDPDVRAHVVIEGGVRITQSGSDGAQVLIRFIGTGEMFGTVSLFSDRCYPADAITVAETIEASWSEAELLELIGIHPQIGINVIRVIGKRLQEAQDRVRELSTQRAERRVAHALLRLARQAGYSTVDGTAIDFPIRRKDVADIAGITLHTASRILTAWEKAGFLLSDHQHLTVRVPSAIVRIADSVDD